MNKLKKTKAIPHEVIGLIPASGEAGRLSPLPCSKELFPIGFRTGKENKEIRPKVVSHYLLEKMKIADITKAYIIVRNGKWDIPAYLGDGAIVDMHLAYLMMRKPFGVPYTLDQAYHFLRNAIVAFGFPDIIFKPNDVYIHLLKKLSERKADVVLGLFPIDQPHKWDIVDYDETGCISRILIKPRETHLQHTWIVAVWSPVFTQFMHEYLSALNKKPSQENIRVNMTEGEELFMSNVMQAAIKSNIHIEGVLFSDGFCLDIGTPDDLAKAVQSMHNHVL